MKQLNMAVALDQCHGFKSFLRPPRCKLPSFSQLDYAMLDFGRPNLQPSSINNHNNNNHSHALECASLQRSVSTPCLSLSTKMEDENDSNSRIDIIGGRGAPKVHALAVEVAVALASGVNPEPISSGLGGAYFIRARTGDIMAVAKPMDEEPLAFNNPKGFAGRLLGQPGLKRSIRIGETGYRELAAYLLDHDGFAGVPPSALVRMSKAKFNVNESETLPALPYKIASLQRFVEHDCDAGDLGPSGFSVSSIHRIGILDVRLLNLDRHAGNILVKKGGTESYSAGAAELIPIDHGFCLPEALDDPYFEWLHWPQASVPFSESEIEYISSLNPFKDAELLRAKVPSLRESAIRVLVLCTTLLKEAVVNSGMCLADIGEIMSREFQGGVENWSAFENLCINAKAASWCSSIRSIVDDNKSSNSGNHQIEEKEEEEDDEIEEVFRFEYGHEKECSDKVATTVVVSQQQHSVGEKKTTPPEMPRVSSETLWMSRVSDMNFFPSDEENSNSSGSNNNNNNSSSNCQRYDDNDNDKRDKTTNHHENNNNNNKRDMNDCYYNINGLTKSVSFAVPNHSNEGGCISFSEMSNEEWESFLEVFKMLLPNFLDGRKAMCLSKQQRLGHSCDF